VGNCCDDATEFYKWIQDQTDKKFLKNKNYTMFGLGDQSFEFFNRCSRTIYACFQKYEMKEYFPYERGTNHESNIEFYFENWRQSLPDCLLKILPENKDLKVEN